MANAGHTAGDGVLDRRAWRAQMPRLGELAARPLGSPNATICDGYGVRRGSVVVPCSECPGTRSDATRGRCCCARAGAFRRATSPQGAGAGTSSASATLVGARHSPINMLLISSDHNNHGLFAQVERVLNQLLLAENLGLPAFVYLGRKVAAARGRPSCDVGENQYFDAKRGSNVWEYYFEPVSSYRLGDPTLNGRPVRLLLAPEADARRHGIRTSRDAVCSYFEFQRYDDTLHEIRTRVRRMGARLVRRCSRVRPSIRLGGAQRSARWRAGGGSDGGSDVGVGAQQQGGQPLQQQEHEGRRPSSWVPLLGVHLRGTDKVTHPKVPLKALISLSQSMRIFASQPLRSSCWPRTTASITI